jgi:hypothetical protein
MLLLLPRTPTPSLAAAVEIDHIALKPHDDDDDDLSLCSLLLPLLLVLLLGFPIVYVRSISPISTHHVVVAM